MFETEYVKSSTIDYINKQFETIPDTRIFIIPGNHDPYIKNSYYTTYTFAKNVHIFTQELEKVEIEDINIYGYGFDNFYMRAEEKEALIQKDAEKINILLTHCDLDGAKNNDVRYNPVSKKELKALEFNYIALGHIHKAMIEENIAYSGSLISLGFDELGKHGMILGEINEQTRETSLEFIPVDDKEFEEAELDISEIFSKEELIENINEMYFQENKYFKIILIRK